MVDLKQGDVKKLEITIKKVSDGAPLNLAGATAKFVMANLITGAVKTNEDATIEDEAGGIVTYTLTATDTSAAADYRAEIQLLFGSDKLTAPSAGYIPVHVHEKLA